MLNLFPFLSYVFVTTFTPGPNNIMSMSNGHQFGYERTLKFLLGIFTGFVIVMLLCAYLNLFLYNSLSHFKLYMGILGAVYMVYLSIIILKSKPGSNSNNKLNSFKNGLLMQFINPKVILYGITVISNFIVPDYNSNTYIILFSLLLALLAFISCSCWALFGSLFQRFLNNHWQIFNIIMSLLLIYSAISISGLPNLLG